MDQHERIKLLESNLDRQLRWIATVESRIGFIFTVDTAMLGVLLTIASKSPERWITEFAVWTVVAASLGLACLVFLAFATFPRMDGPRGSLVFFGGIAQREREQFESEILTVNLQGYAADLAKQCHINAEIANRKFIWVRRALVSLYLTSVPWLVALFYIYSSAAVQVGGI